MNIILVISDQKGKNILFVLDNLQALALEETIKRIKKDEISGVHIVETKKGIYLRANPNVIEDDNLDSISIPLSAITKIGMVEKTVAIKKYYQKALKPPRE